MRNIFIGNEFLVSVQFGFNDTSNLEAFEIFLEQEFFKYKIDRITACFQLNIQVDNFTDAAKIETFYQTMNNYVN